MRCEVLHFKLFLTFLLCEKNGTYCVELQFFIGQKVMDSANQVFKIIEIFYHLDRHAAFTNKETQRVRFGKRYTSYINIAKQRLF